MNTLYFQYVIEVDRTNSITQAAENLFIAQPNLSKAIKELEANLGFKIFKRTSKGVIPTPRGVTFLEHARRIVRQLDEIDALCKPEDKDYFSLNISIPRSSYVADGVTDFIVGLDPTGGLDLNVHETNSLQAIRDVAEGDYSLGVIRYKTEYESYFQDYLKEKACTANCCGSLTIWRSCPNSTRFPLSPHLAEATWIPMWSLSTGTTRSPM